MNREGLLWLLLSSSFVSRCGVDWYKNNMKMDSRPSIAATWQGKNCKRRGAKEVDDKRRKTQTRRRTTPRTRSCHVERVEAVNVYF